MGYYFIIATCLRCGVVFTCNPNYVPTVRLPGRKKEPLCRACAEWRAKFRIELGLEPDPPIHPQAYEPQDENEE